MQPLPSNKSRYASGMENAAGSKPRLMAVPECPTTTKDFAGR